MSTVRLDEEDLDEEDRAILAEVKQKGYYHGRPKSEVCPPPTRIEAPQAGPGAAGAGPAAGPAPPRAQFDAFQRKWDRFDNDEYLEALGALEGERGRPGPTGGAGAAATGPPAAGPPAGPDRAPRRPAAACEFKILLVGDGGVGKSALVKRHATGEFDRQWVPTTGLTVHPLTFATDCGDIRFYVWDLSFSETHYYQGCIQNGRLTGGQGAIIMFDRTSSISHRNVPNWHREIVHACGTIPTVIVGNKVDVQYRRVKAKDILFHRRKQLQYYDLSVQRNYNFEKPFLWLARRLANQPKLQFVQQYAEHPWVELDEALFPRHECELNEAQRLSVGGDEDVNL